MNDTEHPNCLCVYQMGTEDMHLMLELGVQFDKVLNKLWKHLEILNDKLHVKAAINRCQNVEQLE